MLNKVQPTGGWKVLVVDEFSLRVLTAALKMTDLTACNVSVVEKLHLRRKPMKDTEAVYFISPTEQALRKVVEDFQPQARLYARGHVFLTSSLPDSVFDSVLRNSPALKYLMCVTELNVEFLVAESQLFLTSFTPRDVVGPSPFYKMFSPRADAFRDAEIQLIARQITSVCATLGEYPLIRYDGEGVATKQIAEAVQQALDELQSVDPDAFPQTDGPRPSLLVLDRSVDIVAPFLHEFTYQAMVQDLLQIVDNHYSFKSTTIAGTDALKNVLLDEDDTMWASLRHMHIAETIETITRQFQEFTASNKAAAKVQGKDAPKSVKAANELVRDLPQYTTLLSKFALHFNMTQEAMKKFNDGKLEAVAEVEQDMATKQTVDGDPVTEPEDRIRALLKDSKISGGDRARLVMQYIAFHGPLSKEDRQDLGLDQIGFSPQDMKAFSNLNYLTANKEVLVNIDKKKKKAKQAADDVPYHLSRYVPAIKKIAEDLTSGALNVAKYPYVKPPADDGAADSAAKKGQSARTTKANWADKATLASSSTSSAGKTPTGERTEQRFLIYLAGGVTFSELRSIYQLPNRNVMLGSTNIWKPLEFVEALRNLSEPAATAEKTRV
eukprot:Unigene5822_Nuclearia_a/m.17783 Unigene5822_Nuclearia_a/g.17783  ORF Unigene5822_Nuclearia_a/g.17783 Unigene5822_Nuclearia_a/m.17783 type:complete len:609 (+) Unigene5822_Nuclearia_a:2-1828(+)